MTRSSITFAPNNLAFIDKLVSSGEFASRTEYINYLIRAHRERQSEIHAIQAALEEGERSGIETRTFEEIEADVLKRTGHADAA